MEPMCFFISGSIVSKLNNPNASWDTRFKTGSKTILLKPFSPIVIAAGESEWIRYATSIYHNFYLSKALNTPSMVRFQEIACSDDFKIIGGSYFSMNL
jgi:hypothetical protein